MPAKADLRPVAPTVTPSKKEALLRSRHISRATRTLMPSADESTVDLDNLGPCAPLSKLRAVIDAAPSDAGADIEFARAYVSGMAAAGRFTDER